MSDKPKIIIDVDRGGGVKNYHLSEGLDIDVEIRDWYNGAECTDCGVFVYHVDAWTKRVPNMRDWPMPGSTQKEYSLCRSCAEKKGISKQTIRVSPAQAMRNKIKAMGWVEEDLDGIVHEILLEKVSTINNGGLGAQIGFLLGEKWTPENLINLKGAQNVIP